MSHGPIGPETYDVMNVLARAIDDALNNPAQSKKWGFALLVYPFGSGPGRDRINYVGNGDRNDVLVALKELAARWEGRTQTSETKQ